MKGSCSGVSGRLFPAEEEEGDQEKGQGQDHSDQGATGEHATNGGQRVLLVADRPYGAVRQGAGDLDGAAVCPGRAGGGLCGGALLFSR